MQSEDGCSLIEKKHFNFEPIINSQQAKSSHDILFDIIQNLLSQRNSNIHWLHHKQSKWSGAMHGMEAAKCKIICPVPHIKWSTNLH